LDGSFFRKPLARILFADCDDLYLFAGQAGVAHQSAPLGRKIKQQFPKGGLNGATPIFLHVVRAIARGRFTYLLAFMFLLRLTFPFVEESTYGPPVMELLYSFMFISALYAVAASSLAFRVGILLLVAGLASHWWAILALSPISAVAGILCGIIFFCFIGLSLLLHVFGDEQVTGDTIAGAVCVSVLIGILWTLAYQAMYFFNHRAFKNIAPGRFSLPPLSTSHTTALPR
jgi:hypothetical protein